MNKQNLIIYKFNLFYKILKELEENINFNIFEVSNETNLKNKISNFKNYLIITTTSLENINNQFILNNFPINFFKLIEKINIYFLKKSFNEKLEFIVGKYKIDLNSRVMSQNDKVLKLTEKETNIIMYLSKSTNAVKIDALQSDVWGYNPKLETHTVETHIYRLRKKIIKIFNDDKFIISKKNGYQIT